jgi:transcriptional regulator with XRE-family HTH domain
VHNFAANLRRYRREFELSQADLAKLVGCRQGRVSELELGRFTTRDEIAAFAKALGVTERDLLRRPRRIKSTLFADRSARMTAAPVAMTIA